MKMHMRRRTAEVMNFYSLNSIHYRKSSRFVFTRLMEIWESFLLKRKLREPPREAKVLDLGCGNLRYAELLCYRSNIVVGVDISIYMLKIAKALWKNVHLVQADAHYLPFRDKAFQFILCTLAFNHFEYPLHACREVSRVCCGRFIVSLIGSLFKLFERGGFIPFIGKSGVVWLFEKYYSIKDTVKILSTCFRSIRILHTSPLLYLVEAFR